MAGEALSGQMWEKLHAHPLTILSNLWRVLYLTVIPVLRGFLFALRGDLGAWLYSAWIDILVLLVMLTVAVWRWWRVTIQYNDELLAIRTGLFQRREILFRWERITTISAVESFYLRPFRAVRLRADTPGGSAGQADFSILLREEQAEKLLLRRREQTGEQRAREYAPKLKSVLALALLTSNSLGGIIFIAAFISQSGKLLGNEFSQRLIGTLEEVARLLAFGLPPAAAAIAYALLGGWIISFLLTFFRYKDFMVRRDGESLNIRGGIFTRRDYRVSYRDVNFIDIRQSLTTKVLRLYSLYIYAVGYGKHKDDISCIIPTESDAVFQLTRERLFPAYSPSRRQVAPKASGIFRFIGTGLTLCIAIAVAIYLFLRRFPSWRDFILFVGLMSMVPALYYLIIQLIEWATGGFSKSGTYYTMRYAKGFYLHTVVIPESKVVTLELRQSPIQQFTPNCDLLISTQAETKYVHRCKNLNKAYLERILANHI